MTEAATEILTIIKNRPNITFEELVNVSLWSPTIINQVLRTLEKQQRIERVTIKGSERKAKGWRLFRI